MTPAEVNSFKDELIILKYDLIDLNQSLTIFLPGTIVRLVQLRMS